MNSLKDFASRLSEPSKVLLVEDEGAIRDMFTRMSRRFNCTVITAADYDEAMSAVEQYEFDLILLDYILPGANGLDVFREIRNRSVSAPVCIVTGHLTERLIDDARGIGMAAFLRKPCDFTVKNLETMFLTFGIKKLPDEESKKNQIVGAQGQAQALLAQAEMIKEFHCRGTQTPVSP